MCLAPVFFPASVSMAGDSLRRCMRGGSIGIEGCPVAVENVREEATSPPVDGLFVYRDDGHSDFAL